MTARRYTVEEFETMPLEGRWELIDGELFELEWSGSRAALAGGNIFIALKEFAEPRRFGWAFPANAGFVLYSDRATVRSPSAAFVSYDRLPALTDHFVPAPPNIAAEVLSPWDTTAYMVGKVAMYLEAGVQLVWLVNPIEHRVTLFRPDGSPRTLRGGDVLDGGDVLPGLSIPIAEIFA